ncbi:LppX_LprAFG lipoprotein [Aggregatilinea lenta]|uniref:LppX_LprAFG lipoprotein n=1 Tax=Aggregatilinea lenta TaxID=913108 RepID=UPI000E5B8E34|nr:LppX_LprAFG lipoprotein [Aggregatilinea lenta]
MRRYLTYLIVFVAGISLLAACGGSDKDEPLPEARTLLEEATQKVEDAASFELEIALSGYPVGIDVGDFPMPMDLPLQFDYARGTFIAPDRLSANVQVSLGDLAATVDLVAIGNEQFMRSDTLTQGRWVQEEIIPGFAPSVLLAEDGGITSALNSIDNLEMVGRIDLDGLDVYHLRGQIDAANVYALTFGLMGASEGALDSDIYIMADDHTVEQIVLHEPPPDVPTQEPAAAATAEAEAEELEPTVWTISLQGYNEDYAIQAPATEEAKSGLPDMGTAQPDGLSATSEPDGQ